MTDYEARVDGQPVAAADGWRLDLVDRAHGVARLTDGERSLLVLAEGQGSDWAVTLRGRRIPVTVRSWRERVLAEAETEARAHAGPVEVRATLPGLIVTVAGAARSPRAGGAHPDGPGGRRGRRPNQPGCGPPGETNRRFRYLLERGQTGLSVAF